MRRQSTVLRSIVACTGLLLLAGSLESVGLRSQGRQGQAVGLPMAASPEALGFSRARLARLDALMQNEVDQGNMVGMNILVARRGQIAHFKSLGMADRENKIPMKADTMFRIASASKIVTTVALMTLMEEGKLLVTDPVSKYIPGFRNTTVAIPAPPNAPAGTPPFTVVPSKRQITIHDVLTKTSGIAYPGGPTEGLYTEAGFNYWYFVDKTEPMCSWMEKLAKLPFNAQPGERWFNGYTADILGCIIEKISGQNLEEFERARIFQPLKMNDTMFFVPKEKAARLAVVYTNGTTGPGRRGNAPTGALARADGKANNGQGDYVDGPRIAYSGGAGLVTTAPDYARFFQMMLNGGELDGVRILSPKTIELMTANHVGKLYRNGEMGFGFNVEVTLEKGLSDRLGSVGDYGWQGAYFPRFLVDPTEQVISIFLTQVNGYGGTSTLHDVFLNGVYQALVKSDTPLPSPAPVQRTSSEER